MWKKRIKRTRESVEFKANLDNLVGTLKAKLNRLIMPEHSINCSIVEWKLKKLPMWGQ